jgi:hypothetical protein
MSTWHFVNFNNECTFVSIFGSFLLEKIRRVNNTTASQVDYEMTAELPHKDARTGYPIYTCSHQCTFDY